MRGTAWLVLAVCGLSLSCVGRSVAPQVHGRIEVFVHWQEYPLADRDVTIVELDLVRTTDTAGIAAFRIPAGSYTLRAHVNSGGPAGYRDMGVTVRPGATERVEVVDCLPCVSPNG